MAPFGVLGRAVGGRLPLGGEQGPDHFLRRGHSGFYVPGGTPKHRWVVTEIAKAEIAWLAEQPTNGPGFVAVDFATPYDDGRVTALVQQFIQERLQASDFHPDSWPPVVIRDPRDTQAKLAVVAGDKYSYRELDDFTDRIEKTVKTVPQVS